MSFQYSKNLSWQVSHFKLPHRIKERKEATQFVGFSVEGSGPKIFIRIITIISTPNNIPILFLRYDLRLGCKEFQVQFSDLFVEINFQ